jgi:hypothetical protein
MLYPRSALRCPASGSASGCRTLVLPGRRETPVRLISRRATGFPSQRSLLSDRLLPTIIIYVRIPSTQHTTHNKNNIQDHDNRSIAYLPREPTQPRVSTSIFLSMRHITEFRFREGNDCSLVGSLRIPSVMPLVPFLSVFPTPGTFI